MARKAFYSFHYELDNWRVSQVRNIGVVDGNRPASDNDWESVKRGGNKAIEKWIDSQLFRKSVAIVLIGEKTAEREWIKYEINKAWNEGKGLLGIHIHNIKDKDGNKTSKGKNPFEDIKISGKLMSDIVKTYDPGWLFFSSAYEDIRDNMADWIEAAIKTRRQHG